MGSLGLFLRHLYAFTCSRGSDRGVNSLNAARPGLTDRSLAVLGCSQSWSKRPIVTVAESEVGFGKTREIRPFDEDDGVLPCFGRRDGSAGDSLFVFDLDQPRWRENRGEDRLISATALSVA